MKKVLLAIGLLAMMLTDTTEARFVSVDPVKPNTQNGQNFNRYHYANNNPYKFTDPDGREATVKNGRIYIQPLDPTAPPVNLPNNVGAGGFTNTCITCHSYDVRTPTGITDAGAMGNGFANNPTPGADARATPMGTVNNVGHLPYMALDGGTNMVRSYSIPSPNPAAMTDITVNYTIAGQHSAEEGFVMRFGEIGANGSITMRSYGEGNAIIQAPILEDVWKPEVDKVWQQNHREIEREIK